MILILRNVAFCVILCRAGIRLKMKNLKELKWKILKLSFIPSTIEMVAVAVASYLILNIPIAWAFLLGFID